MTRIPGKFVWFECVTRDLAKSQAFYGEVLGWKVESFPMGPGASYDMIRAGASKDDTIGGWTALEAKDPRPPHFISYVSVDDVDATLVAVTKAGGTIAAPAFDVPTVGRMAAVIDPTGAAFMLYSGASGDDAPDEPGWKAGRFYWNELLTDDPAKALAFYKAVFGYTSKDMDMGPMGTYYVLEKGGIPRGGIMKTQMPGAPSNWLPYVAVDDADATAQRVTRNGGKVIVEPSDIPGIGRFAVATDPQGATFAVIRPAT
jgi:predicted enzyme related to lactoylglutathione lyase